MYDTTLQKKSKIKPAKNYNSNTNLENPLENLIESYIGMYQKIDEAKIPEDAKKGLYALVNAELMNQILEKSLNNMMIGYAMKGLESQILGQNKTQKRYTLNLHHTNPISSGQKPYESLINMSPKKYANKTKSLESKIKKSIQVKKIKQLTLY